MSVRVVVTGGGAGIGLAIVRAFLATGAKVYACDIDAGALDAARRALPGLLTGLCDMGDPAAVEAMIGEAAGALGGIDVLVNNAGIGGPTRPVAEVELAEWEEVLKVDLTGTFVATKYAIPHLIRSGNGVIIVLSSAAGRFGYPHRSPYATAKWGLIGLTKTLSMELGDHNIRVNAIAPGGVEGDRARRVFEGRAEATGQSVEEVMQAGMANQSIKRLVDPADIAALAVFLASDAAKLISGQVIPIDGDQQRN